MPIKCLGALLTLASLVGCIPLHSTRTARDVVLSTSVRVEEPSGPATRTLSIINSDARGVFLRVNQSFDCRRVEIEDFETRTTEVREVEATLHVGAYVAAATAFGLGAWILTDAPNVADGSDPRLTNPVGRDGAYGVGIGVEVAGLLPLIYGIATSAQDVDREEVGPRRAREATSQNVTCHDGPAPNVSIDVEVLDHSRTITRRSIGTTDVSGSLSIDLIEAVGDEIADGRSIAVIAGRERVVVRVEPLLPEAESLAWGRLWATGFAGSAGLRGFLAFHPRGAHAAEARDRLRDARMMELRTSISDALSRDDLAAVDASLEELRRLAPDDPMISETERRRAERVQALDAAEAERQATAARAAADAHATLVREAERVESLLRCHLWRDGGSSPEWYDASHPAGGPELGIWIGRNGRTSGAWAVRVNDYGWVALTIVATIGQTALGVWRVIGAEAESILLQRYDLSGVPMGSQTTMRRVDAEFPTIEARAAQLMRDCRAIARQR